jgi:hypothetical protein
VAGLHEALTFLESPISDVEKEAQHDRAFARRTICKLQTSHQLTTTDDVAADKAINAILAKKRAFDLPSGGADLLASNPSPRTRLSL